MNKKQLYMIAEGVIACLVLVFIVILLLANRGAKADFGEIKKAFEAEDTVKELTLKNVNDVRKVFGIDGGAIEECLYYSGSQGIMDVSTLLVVKVHKGQDMEQVESAVQEYLEVQKKNFDGYGTNQHDLLEAAVTVRKGDYYFCAVSEHAQLWEEVFRRCF